MRRIKLIIIIIIIPAVCISQTAIWDIAKMEVLISNHKSHHSSLTQISSNEAEISALQKQISVKMVAVQEIQSKLHNSLKDVSAILHSAKSVLYAKDIITDIGKYQKQMLNLVSDDPKLITVAWQMEAQLVGKTADLMDYIYKAALVGSDLNLMNNKQRLDLINYVIKELRKMRGMTYSIVRQLKMAKRQGILKALQAQQKGKDNFYEVDRVGIMNNVLANFKIK